MSLPKFKNRPTPPGTPEYRRLLAAVEADELSQAIETQGISTSGNVVIGGDLTVTGTTTMNGPIVLGDAAADSLTVNATTTYGDPINYSNATGITAFATGGQASATALTEEINNVTTVATAGDSVKLPAAVAGKHVHVKNSGATALDIFPATSDSIDALAVNLAIRIQPGSSVDFYAKDAIVWESNVDASLTIVAPTTNTGQLELKATSSAGNTVTTITNASQAATRVYTIPDAGANANFVMTEGASTINGTKTYTAPIVYSLATGITAFAGGGQASATALVREINNVTVVATDGDSVKLPSAVEGLKIVVKNADNSNVLAIFPFTGDAIDAEAANASITIPSYATVVFIAKDATTWESNIQIISAINRIYVGPAQELSISDLGVNIGVSSAAFISKYSFDTLSGAGAIPITNFCTKVTTTAANALTIANPTFDGQRKRVILVVDGGDGTLTGDFNSGGNTTVVFADAGDYIELMGQSGSWSIIDSGNTVDGVTEPVVS